MKQLHGNLDDAGYLAGLKLAEPCRAGAKVPLIEKSAGARQAVRISLSPANYLDAHMKTRVLQEEPLPDSNEH